jgi:hypothetical protein
MSHALASVTAIAVERYRADRAPLEASRSLPCSPHLGSVVDVQPLGELLDRALNGGAPLGEGVRVHAPEAVRELSRALDAAWGTAAITPAGCDDFFVEAIERIVALYRDAAAAGDAVVSLTTA